MKRFPLTLCLTLAAGLPIAPTGTRPVLAAEEAGNRAARFKGVIKAIDARTGRFVVPVNRGRDGDPKPVMVDVLVHTGPVTRFFAPAGESRAAAIVRLSDLGVGQSVQIQGAIQRDGSVAAHEVTVYQKGAAGEREGGIKTGPRDGERPFKEGPRDGERPFKTGPRDGEGPAKFGPRDGEGAKFGPRDGEGPAKFGPRDGERPFKTGPRDGEGPAKFGPRDGEGAKFGPREGDRPFKEGFRSGDRPFKEGFREGDRPFKEGFREGDRPSKEGVRDGERPFKTGPRDGERPFKTGPRDGERPFKEGPRDGERPFKEGPRDGEGGKGGAEEANANGFTPGRVKAVDLRRSAFLFQYREGQRDNLRNVDALVFVTPTTRLIHGRATKEGVQPGAATFRDIQPGAIVHVQASRGPDGFYASEIRVFQPEVKRDRGPVEREGDGRKKPAEGEGQRKPEGDRKP